MISRLHIYSLAALLSGLASAFAEPVTRERVAGLPEAERTAWTHYLERSQSNAALDAAALRAELEKHHLTDAVRAPSGGDFKLSEKKDHISYAGEEAKRLADVILSYQTAAGGWSKHTGYVRGPRQPGMLWSSQYEPGASPHYLATFDNGSTTEQLHFLSAVWLATKREDCKAGFIKGLDFILAAQFPNGGWPQVYPLEGGYHDDITYNDDAMVRILELLHGVVQREPYYAFVDEARRERAAKALAAGVDCVLKTQVEQGGKKTVWCAQHDALTLRPGQARKLEPATLSGLESAHTLQFLMTVTDPPPEVKAAIEAGLNWLNSVKLTNLSKTKVEGKTEYVVNTNSTEIYWARFYDLTNSLPVFPGRDGQVYNSFADMSAHNRVGYDYFTTLPGSILNNGQKKWRKMLAGQAVKPKQAHATRAVADKTTTNQPANNLAITNAP